MSDSAADFSEFFHQVWDTPPFDWQVTLAERVVTEEKWPSVIDLPTGSGKTAALDIAVYALAAKPEKMPRRIAFVVDRRTIVDQTAVRAQKLAERLQEALSEPGESPLAKVARRLTELSATGMALDIGRLRGGVSGPIDPQEWLRWPDQPAVIVSTVDQFGSRLLFRGYGVGRRMAPIHAGLTGKDTLVLLDEVHLSTALVETLEALENTGPAESVTRPNQIVRMSATPGMDALTRFPESTSILTQDARLAERINARKNCRLLPAIGTKTQNAATAWQENIAKLTRQLEITEGVVGVVVNRVATAVAVHRRLRELGHDTLLITGRMRGWERAKADSQATQWAQAGREHQPGLRFVVATQCIEVGADYSFDALITEICPLASLRQRLGRLDRRGQHAATGRPAKALIVSTTGQVKEDQIYGTALDATLVAIKQRFKNEEFDGGPLSQDLSCLGEGLDVSAVQAAVLMPNDLDELASTTTDRQLDSTVDALLHGFREPNADVSLVWRFDLPARTDENREAAAKILTALPALPLERIEIPVAAARQWLADPAAPQPEIADIDMPGERSPGQRGRQAWRLDEDHKAELVTAGDLRPGDVVFIPADWGGLVDGVWSPESTELVSDIADEVVEDAGWTVLRPRDDDPWRHCDIDEESDISVFTAQFVAEANRRKQKSSRPAVSNDVVRYGDRWAVVSPARRILDGRDTTNSHLGVRVSLCDHLLGVAETAREMARRCGLPNEMVADLGLAGQWHDLGKADERFQLSLAGGLLDLATSDELLAKSRRRGGHIRTGDPYWDYPPGTRHEYLSAALVSQSPELLAQAHDLDLVLHLIVTHHGYARPWPQVVTDPEPRDIEVTVRDQRLVANTQLPEGFGAESAMRFHRLLRRYGHHGLAWLEAVFRLADHRRSESESHIQEVAQ